MTAEQVAAFRNQAMIVRAQAGATAAACDALLAMLPQPEPMPTGKRMPPVLGGTEPEKT
jgi:hypothetical protein